MSLDVAETGARRSILTDAQLADYDRDGFLIIKGLFGAGETAEILNWTEELETWLEAPGKYMKYFETSLKRPGQRLLNRIENFYPYHDGFKELVDGPKLKGIAGELFGESAVLFKEKINFKLAGGDGFKPHQDQQAGWGDYADLFISVLVCIDEQTEENGCLKLVPGRGDKNLVGDEWRPLDDQQMADMEFVPFHGKPGDVVLFDSFVSHGSEANLTDEPRRALYITYNKHTAGDHRAQYYADKRKSYPPDCEREDGKEYVFRV
jgi:ectoine hydroxylase-related dioxygenase (phytanoyl-CoA dioxygenase family)